jgi:hypothetical protein
VIDESLLLDFGLGVARREYSGQVPWGVALPLEAGRADHRLARTDVAGEDRGAP